VRGVPEAAEQTDSCSRSAVTILPVSQRTRLKKSAKLRSWRVVIMRSRGEYLGSVEAPDREKAEAIKLFALD
jgi:hypothetical protein